jgi:hypothetical protein
LLAIGGMITQSLFFPETGSEDAIKVPPPNRPGEWLEHSPVLTILLVLLASGWLVYEFSRQSAILAISNLNTYNFMFVMAGLLLHWRPKRFLAAVAKAVPATSGVLIQFPLYGAIASILTQAKNSAGLTVSDQISHAFVSVSTQHLYPLLIGIYSAVLGFFVPSGGGKWLLEAPYVMQAANDLKVHLGWAVQVYNAAEALPNLITAYTLMALNSRARVRRAPTRRARKQTDPRTATRWRRLGGAAAADRRRWRQWVPPINRSQRDHPKTERARFRLGANDGARAFAANATDDDVAAAAAGRAARFSYGVMENTRH